MSPISKPLQHVPGWSGGENPAIRLLKSIDSCGSTNRAAKDVGLSYKAAWEKNESLNNFSEKPLKWRLTFCGHLNRYSLVFSARPASLILLKYDEDAPEPRTLGAQEIAKVLRVSAMKMPGSN